MATPTQEQLDELQRQLSLFSVALFGISQDESCQESLKFAGSGSLVVSEGRHFVLTAAHVWTDTLSQDKVNRVCFTVKPDSPGQQLCIPKDWVKPSEEDLAHYPKHERSQGPDQRLDLWFLRLPRETAARMEAHGRVFYNLGKRHEDALASEPDLLTSGYAITGCPAADAAITEQYADLKMTTFVFPEGKYFPPNAASIDYWELQSKSPRDFKGVSGGGVWSFRFDGDRIFTTLEGVAFYQEDGGCLVRCHGRKAIYCHLPGIPGGGAEPNQ